MLIDESGPARQLVREFATLRVTRGVSQDAIATQIGTSQGAIGNIENGQRVPKLTTFIAMLGALGLGLQVVELQGDEEAGDA